MDRERFDSLPANVQEVIRELRPEMTTFASEFHDTQNVQPALEWAESEHGVEIVSLDAGEEEAWQEIADQRATDWISANSNADFDAEAVVERMRELAEEHAGNTP